jgi:Ser/Thr protein kinase RdoA (MazF antagonist)
VFEASPHALRTIAEIHRAWSGRADELLALGAQDRRVEAPELDALPDTLVHGDFHPGNAVVDGDRAVIFDWSDACVANPLFDLHLYLSDVADERERDELVEAYASGWNGEVEADTLRELLPPAAPFSRRHQAESYRAIDAACAPDERWWFAAVLESFRDVLA